MSGLVAALIFISSPLVAAAESEDWSLDDEFTMPVALTPARLAQPRSEVPGSISIISREVIDASGIRDLSEIFRLVPGMAVGARENGRALVNYHGTNYRNTRRMQVLVDGRSVYHSTFSRVPWEDLHLALEDIERIEVTRGPNAAAYGTNSFLGVINIITRHPSDTPGLEIATRGGGRNVEDYYLRYGDQLADGVDYRISATAQRDDGFDVLPNGRSQDHLEARINGATDKNQWELQAGYGDYYVERYFDEETDTTTIDTRKAFVSGKWVHQLNEQHFFHVKAYYRVDKEESKLSACTQPIELTQELTDLFLATSNDYIEMDFVQWLGDVAAAGTVLPPPPAPNPESDALALAALNRFISLETSGQGGPICGDLNEDIRREQAELEFQDTVLVNDGLRIVSGLSLREDTGDSETYFAGKLSNTTARAFTNIEYRPLDSVVVNLGGMYEYDRKQDDNFSPKLGVNWHVSQQQTLRFQYSTAERTPDLFETDADWRYLVTNLNPTLDGATQAYFFPYAISEDGDYTNAKIISREVGYYGYFSKLGLELDVRVFHDTFTDLYIDGFTLRSFDSRRQADLTQEGAELEFNYRPSSDWLFKGAYAYIGSDAETFREEEFTPEHSGSMMINWTPGRWLWGATYYHTESIRKRQFRRVDLNIKRTFNVNRSLLTVHGTLQHRLDDDSLIQPGNAYRDNNQAMLTLRLHY